MRVLYLSYNDATSALAESQVLPYLVGLAARGHDITLLSWQHGSEPNATFREMELSERLAQAGIRWRTLRYHARPAVASTLFDIARGIAYARALHLQQQFDLVHARSYVPAAVALGFKRVTGIPYIFDMRGMMAEEYVEGGNWSSDSLPYQLTKSMEGSLLSEAAATVVLTRNIGRHLVEQARVRASTLSVIPCCVDLHRFQPATTRRSAADPLRLVYAGSVGTWYLLDEMVQFASLGLPLHEVRLLILNADERSRIRAALDRSPALRGRASSIGIPPKAVPGYLAGSDVGLSFRKSTFSQRASSPIKVAEYLASGLPVVSTPGVGDLDEQLATERVGVTVSGTDPSALQEVWPRLTDLTMDPTVAERARAAAERHYSLNEGVTRYDEIYRGLGQ